MAGLSSGHVLTNYRLIITLEGIQHCIALYHLKGYQVVIINGNVRSDQVGAQGVVRFHSRSSGEAKELNIHGTLFKGQLVQWVRSKREFAELNVTQRILVESSKHELTEQFPGLSFPQLEFPKKSLSLLMKALITIAVVVAGLTISQMSCTNNSSKKSTSGTTVDECQKECTEGYEDFQRSNKCSGRNHSFCEKVLADCYNECERNPNF